jgi:excisionase family DNA binding protein
MSEQDELLTVREAGTILKVSKPTMYGLMARGELPWVQVGGQRRISTAALTAFVAGHTRGPKAAKPA